MVLRLVVSAKRALRVGERPDERQAVTHDQDDRDEGGLLHLGARGGRTAGGEDRWDQEPHGRQDQQGGVGARDPCTECLSAVLETTRQHRRAKDEQQVADDGARDGRLHHGEEPGLEGEEGDDQLGDVAERRVEDAAHLRAGDGAKALRGEAHDPGEAQDGHRGEHEHRRALHVGAKLERDRGDREGERHQEGDPARGREGAQDRHGAAGGGGVRHARHRTQRGRFRATPVNRPRTGSAAECRSPPPRAWRPRPSRSRRPPAVPPLPERRPARQWHPPRTPR